MPKKYRSLSPEFREEAARMVIETSRVIADVARELGISETSLGNWVRAYGEKHAAESVSAWVNDALRLKADHDQRLGALDDFLAAYEAEHGQVTEAEMRDAVRRARSRAVVVRADPQEQGPGPGARPGRGLMLVLDAGAFVAVERGDRDVVALVKRERLAGRVPVTSGGVVAQVWRGGTGRQAPLARLLAGTDVTAVDDVLGRRAGMLLARSGQSDAAGATVVCLAGDGDDILTSDTGDLRALAEAAGIHVDLIPV